jgi:hypothetical protein
VLEKSIQSAAAAIRDAAALLITAGAGMGVDSGLPDFRGTEGFWAAYPPYRKLGLQFLRSPIPLILIAIRIWLGDFTGIGCICIATPGRMRATPFCAIGLYRSRTGALSSPRMWTDTSQPPDSRPTGSLNVMARSIICNAPGPAMA